MNPQFIEEKIQLSNQVAVQLLLHPLYNLEAVDTVSLLPSHAGIIAVCGRINGRIANCRVIRHVPNIKKAIQEMYEEREEDAVLRNYMRSIKTKMLLYTSYSYSSEEMEDLHHRWTELLAPVCTVDVNKVY